MATSKYDILELRAVVKPQWSELYVRISDANDFMPIGGWYKKVIPDTAATLEELSKAVVTQEFLFWDRGAPP
jgi:hypothetical protein